MGTLFTRGRIEGGLSYRPTVEIAIRVFPAGDSADYIEIVRLEDLRLAQLSNVGVLRWLSVSAVSALTSALVAAKVIERP